MSAVVLPPRELAIEQADVDRAASSRCGSRRDAEILGAEQAEHRLRRDRRHETALMVEPLRVALFRHAVADEGQARRAQRDQFVRVDRQIAGGLAAERRFGGAVLQEVAGHPVILARAGEVLDRLAPIAAMQLGAAFAGRPDQHHREARIERHRHQRRLAVARNAFDADLLGVDGFLGFEIIEAARRAPCPRPQRAPVVRLARLSFIRPGR